MSTILLKSYTGEIFLSLSILLQLIYNIRIVNSKDYNFPEISTETFYQCFFILYVTTILVSNSHIEGFFYGSFLVSDDSTRSLKLILLILSLVVLPVLHKSFKFLQLNFFEYYTLFLLSVLALLLMINSCNFLSFYILMEMQALCYYILAAFRRNSIFSVEAGLKYFIAGSFISGFYLLGVSIIYGIFGTFDLSELYILSCIPLESYDSTMSSIFKVGVLLILGSLLFKIACFPFHFWAPDVYEGSPITSTVIFSICPKISLFSFFLKVICTLILADLENMKVVLSILITFGCLSTVYGTFLAISQKRLKRLVIYSSIAQTGFMVAGLSICTLNGFTDTYFFLIIYLVTSLLIWSYFIIFYEGSAIASSFFNLELKPLYTTSLENLYKYNGVFAFPLIIIFFSISGVPPFAGFLIKVLVLYDLVKENYLCYSIIFVFVSAISIYYYLRVIKVSYFEPRKNSVSSPFFFQKYNQFSDFAIFIISTFTFSLIYLFFFPTTLLLLCQYVTFI